MSSKWVVTFEEVFELMLSDEQRAERNQLCEAVVLATQLTDQSAFEMLRATIRTLPPDHWLNTRPGLESAVKQLEHQKLITKFENKNLKQVHS